MLRNLFCESVKKIYNIHKYQKKQKEELKQNIHKVLLYVNNIFFTNVTNLKLLLN